MSKSSLWANLWCFVLGVIWLSGAEGPLVGRWRWRVVNQWMQMPKAEPEFSSSCSLEFYFKRHNFDTIKMSVWSSKCQHFKKMVVFNFSLTTLWHQKRGEEKIQTPRNMTLNTLEATGQILSFFWNKLPKKRPGRHHDKCNSVRLLKGFWMGSREDTKCLYLKELSKTHFSYLMESDAALRLWNVGQRPDCSDQPGCGRECGLASFVRWLSTPDCAGIST